MHTILLFLHAYYHINNVKNVFYNSLAKGRAYSPFGDFL